MYAINDGYSIVINHSPGPRGPGNSVEVEPTNLFSACELGTFPRQSEVVTPEAVGRIATIQAINDMGVPNLVHRGRLALFGSGSPEGWTQRNDTMVAARRSQKIAKGEEILTQATGLIGVAIRFGHKCASIYQKALVEAQEAQGRK